jgi:hypothetical protein
MIVLPGAYVISLPHPTLHAPIFHTPPPPPSPAFSPLPLSRTHSLSLADVTLTQFMSAVIWRSAYFLLHLMQFYRLFRYNSLQLL